MNWIMSAFADEAGAAVEAQIKALKRANLQHVDLRSVGEYNISSLPVAEARTASKQFADAGIKVNMFGSPLGKIDVVDDMQTELDKLRHLAELAEIFECRDVRIFSYYNRKEKWDLPRWQEESLQRLAALKTLAAELNMVLYHENEGGIFGDRCPQIQVIAKELRGGNFKLIFDFDNYNRGGDNVWDNWLKLRDVTDAFHLKESDKDGQHVPVGTGAGYVREILADALSRDWSGCLSLEPHLKRSKAVMATGPGGKPNESFVDLGPEECFQIAAVTARELLDDLKAPAV